jgi:hypothetical protein
MVLSQEVSFVDFQLFSYCIFGILARHRLRPCFSPMSNFFKFRTILVRTFFACLHLIQPFIFIMALYFSLMAEHCSLHFELPALPADP